MVGYTEDSRTSSVQCSVLGSGSLVPLCSIWGRNTSRALKIIVFDPIFGLPVQLSHNRSATNIPDGDPPPRGFFCLAVHAAQPEATATYLNVTIESHFGP